MRIGMTALQKLIDAQASPKQLSPRSTPLSRKTSGKKRNSAGNIDCS